ncbi:unnamed protein product, partial [Didymodactylos carnosus]
GFVGIPSENETALQIAIATVGPTAIEIDSPQSSFYFYSPGFYNEPACSTTQWSHKFVLVGYDTVTNDMAMQEAKSFWGEA